MTTQATPVTQHAIPPMTQATPVSQQAIPITQWVRMAGNNGYVPNGIPAPGAPYPTYQYPCLPGVVPAPGVKIRQGPPVQVVQPKTNMNGSPQSGKSILSLGQPLSSAKSMMSLGQPLSTSTVGMTMTTGSAHVLPPTYAVPGIPMTHAVPGIPMTREQILEKHVRDLVNTLNQKDRQIQELQTQLAKYTGKKTMMSNTQRGSTTFLRKRSMSSVKLADPEDEVHKRLDAIYAENENAVPYVRINRGFYRFGDTTAELEIINGKLMAKSECGWNRGSYATMERFLKYCEEVESMKATN